MEWQGWALISLFLTAWGGLLLWAVKALLARFQQQMDERFAALASDRRKESGKVSNLERELLELKAALPRDYVMREDWIRFGGAMDSKLDAIHAELVDLTKGVYGR